MTPKELEDSYNSTKFTFHNYIDGIKKNSIWDLYTIINATLVKNPFASTLPLLFFKKETKKTNLLTLFLKRLPKYYLKVTHHFLSYIVATAIYKIYFKKKRQNRLETIIEPVACAIGSNGAPIFLTQKIEAQ